MNEKRDITIGFKLSESEKEKAEKIANIYGHKPGSLASVLLRNYIEAHEKHGENLRFPPKFEYYTYAETSQSTKETTKKIKNAG